MRYPLICCILLACSISGAMSADETAVFREYKALNGNWRMNGGDVWEFNGTELRIRLRNQALQKRLGQIKYSIKLNPDETPKQIDLVRISDSSQEEVLVGIYEIEGTGGLNICIGAEKNGEAVRPEAFITNNGASFRFERLKSRFKE